MTATDNMLPGEHPHSDRPNWQPAETVEDYFFNIREGLEKYSVERLTKLLGLNRTLARCEQVAHIPAGLFERLVKVPQIGIKQLAQIGLAFRRDSGNKPAEIELCPHCGEVIRVRMLVGARARKVIQQWIDDGTPDASGAEDEADDAA